MYAWDVPGARVILPFVTADPLKDDEDWWEAQQAGLPQQEFLREYGVDFGVFTGKPVYPEYRDHMHRSPGPLPFAPNRPIIRGWDIPGPLACVWMQLYPLKKPREGSLAAPGYRLHVLAELYGDAGVADFGRLVIAQQALIFEAAGNAKLNYIDWADPAAWSESANDRRTAASVLKAECGIVLNPGPVDNLARQEPVRKWLTRSVPTDRPNEPTGAMLIDPSCTMVRGGMKSGYHYKEIEKSGRFKEIPEKNEYSHVMNALEYGIARLDHSDQRGDIPEARGRIADHYAKRERHGAALGSL